MTDGHTHSPWPNDEGTQASLNPCWQGTAQRGSSVGCRDKSLQRPGTPCSRGTNRHTRLCPSLTWEPRARARLRHSCQSVACTACSKAGRQGASRHNTGGTGEDWQLSLPPAPQGLQAALETRQLRGPFF